jgi:hypothetical protein
MLRTSYLQRNCALLLSSKPSKILGDTFSIFRQNVIRRNVIRRNIIRRNVIRRNIVRRNVIRRNIIRRNVIRRIIIRRIIIRPIIIRRMATFPPGYDKNKQYRTNFTRKEIKALYFKVSSRKNQFF